MTNLPADFHNRIEVPHGAPAPPSIMFNKEATFDDAFPERFFSKAALEKWLKERSALQRLLTIDGISWELLYDPSKNEKPKDGEWRPVLWFIEVETGLVLNKTRGEHMKLITNSPLLRNWGRRGQQVALAVGDFNGHYQIGIEHAPDPDPDWMKPEPTATAQSAAPNGRNGHQPPPPANYDDNAFNQEFGL